MGDLIAILPEQCIANQHLNCADISYSGIWRPSLVKRSLSRCWGNTFSNFTVNKSSPKTSCTSSSAPSRTPPPVKEVCRGKYPWRRSWMNGWTNRECHLNSTSSRYVSFKYRLEPFRTNRRCLYFQNITSAELPLTSAVFQVSLVIVCRSIGILLPGEVNRLTWVCNSQMTLNEKNELIVTVKKEVTKWRTQNDQNLKYEREPAAIPHHKKKQKTGSSFTPNTCKSCTNFLPMTAEKVNSAWKYLGYFPCMHQFRVYFFLPISFVSGPGFSFTRLPVGGESSGAQDSLLTSLYLQTSQLQRGS